ncbi:MAG: hypothetical protein QXQ69_02595 [Candidatus Aenigmatarchaeota archaeon]
MRIYLIMLKQFISLLLTSILFFPIVKADVGVGIKWSLEEIFLREFEEKCIFYSVYNPFDTEVTAQISVDEKLASLITKIEPKEVYLPPYTGDPKDNAAKLANKQDVKICFYANPFRWPPFYPVNYSGAIFASAIPGKAAGLGSTAVSVVQAPLTVRIGNFLSFYIFVISVVILTFILLVIALRIKKKLLSSMKKPEIEKETQESNLKYSENKKNY